MHVKISNFILLCASVLFYASFGVKQLLFLFLCIMITFIGAVMGEKYDKKYILLALTANISLLVVMKYLPFFYANLDVLSRRGGGKISQLLPIGLSFYIFQSSSYLLDVYHGKVHVETNIVDFALYVSFFGTIVSGPIQKARNFLPQIKEKRVITDKGIQKAILFFLWGIFIKMVIADRLTMFVDTVWNSYEQFEGFTLFAAAVAYSIQIYLDFSGYSYMAVGVAAMFGFTLTENFRRPYLGTSIGDFWKRWHISLTEWFREYLYIPLGGNRRGSFRKYINMIVVFLVSGLWHGAEWSFVVWGGIHAAYHVVGNLTEKWRIVLCGRLKINRETFSYGLWQRLCVFLMAAFAWIFFRAPTLGDAFGYIKGMFSCWNPWVLFDKSLYTLGLAKEEWIICAWGMVIILITSCIEEKGTRIGEVFCLQNIVFRYLCYFALFMAVVIFGVYGPGYDASKFIYMGF